MNNYSQSWEQEMSEKTLAELEEEIAKQTEIVRRAEHNLKANKHNSNVVVHYENAYMAAQGTLERLCMIAEQKSNESIMGVGGNAKDNPHLLTNDALKWRIKQNTTQAMQVRNAYNNSTNQREHQYLQNQKEEYEKILQNRAEYLKEINAKLPKDLAQNYNIPHFFFGTAGKTEIANIKTLKPKELEKYIDDVQSIMETVQSTYSKFAAINDQGNNALNARKVCVSNATHNVLKALNARIHTLHKALNFQCNKGFANVSVSINAPQPITMKHITDLASQNTLVDLLLIAKTLEMGGKWAEDANKIPDKDLNQYIKNLEKVIKIVENAPQRKEDGLGEVWTQKRVQNLTNILKQRLDVLHEAQKNIYSQAIGPAAQQDDSLVDKMEQLMIKSEDNPSQFTANDRSNFLKLYLNAPTISADKKQKLEEFATQCTGRR